MRGIVDRFEGDLVVVEINGETKDFHKSLFPKELDAGDAVIYDGEKFLIDKNETDKLRKEIQDLMNELWED